MESYKLFHGGVTLNNNTHQDGNKVVSCSPENNNIRIVANKPKPAAFTESPVPMKLSPVKASKPMSNIGFSQVGMLDRNIRKTEDMNLGELNKYVLKNKKDKDMDDTEDEPLDNKASMFSVESRVYAVDEEHIAISSDEREGRREQVQTKTRRL